MRTKQEKTNLKIKHNSRYQTYYLHLSRFARGVRQGARVRQGQVIGYVGSTGSATASHLDYRIKVGDKFVNPRTVKLPAKEPVPRDELALYNVARDACLVRLFETTVGEETLLVGKPVPPMQSRMAMPF